MFLILLLFPDSMVNSNIRLLTILIYVRVNRCWQLDCYVCIYMLMSVVSMEVCMSKLHLKKDRTDASIYQQLFMEIRDRYHDYIPVYTDGTRDGNAVPCPTVFPSNTVISMRLPDSASVFTAEVGAIIKALEQIKDSIASKYIVFTDSLSCLQALHHMKLEHPLIGMVIRKCVFLNIAKKDIVFLLGTQPYWH